MICKVNLNPLLILFLFILVSCKKGDTSTTTTTLETDIDTPLLAKRYDSACFLMTHNAMNNIEEGFHLPNQTLSITHQLERGVRGLMIDTYDGTDGVALTYHVSPGGGSRKLVDDLQEIKDFMNDHPKAIISIIFENDGSNSQLLHAIDSVHLGDISYQYTGGEWPRIQTLVDNNTRLVLFEEQDKSPSAPYVMYAWGNVFDTKYTWSNVNEFDCDVNRGGGGTKKLYLINHWLGGFLGLPDSTLAPQANTHAVLSKRVQECTSANNHFLNYLGVDFFHIGDAMFVVDSINGIH